MGSFFVMPSGLFNHKYATNLAIDLQISGIKLALQIN